LGLHHLDTTQKSEQNASIQSVIQIDGNTNVQASLQDALRNSSLTCTALQCTFSSAGTPENGTAHRVQMQGIEIVQLNTLTTSVN
jgi:hypothetical protein